MLQNFYAYIPFEKEELIIFNRRKNKESSLATTRGAKWTFLRIRDDKIVLGRREGVHIYIEKWDESGILCNHMIRPGKNPAQLRDFDIMGDLIKIRYYPQEGRKECVELWACSNFEPFPCPMRVPFPDCTSYANEMAFLDILWNLDFENGKSGYFAAEFRARRNISFLLIFRNISAPEFIRRVALPENTREIKFSTVNGRKIMAAITFDTLGWIGWRVHIYDMETGEIVIVLTTGGSIGPSYKNNLDNLNILNFYLSTFEF